MHSLLENRIVFATVVSAFLLTSAVAFHAGSPNPTGRCFPTPEVVNIAHGPTMPPDPWEGTSNFTLVAHGPTMPPDPWEGTGNVAPKHGPTMPPDPWEGTSNLTVA